LLPHVKARAYFVQDHEPEFYATSAEALFAARTYQYGMPCIAASPWLAEVVEQNYGARATAFELGVDAGEYRPQEVPRRKDTVVFYARETTPRRAVALGVLALAEVVRRRPNLRVVFYGTRRSVDAPFAYEHLGIVSAERLSRLYAEATVGLSLSLTNYSLIPQEMMACGLPVVELKGRACESVFGDDGAVITLADDSPAALADAIDELLEDEDRREHMSQSGIDFVAERTWPAAIDVIEGALRRALTEQAEAAIAVAGAS
jgi:glycosyltransferase involved in cell wall biosynthesis